MGRGSKLGTDRMRLLFEQKTKVAVRERNYFPARNQLARRFLLGSWNTSSLNPTVSLSQVRGP